MSPIEIDCMSTTFYETMEDDSKLLLTSAVGLTDSSSSTLSFKAKHNICSLTAITKFLDMIINIVQCPITFSTIEEQVYVADGRLY